MSDKAIKWKVVDRIKFKKKVRQLTQRERKHFHQHRVKITNDYETERWKIT